MAEGLDDAISRWGKLQESRSEYEPIWLEVEEKQSQALAAKKKLAEDTKAFKRLPEADRLGSWPELLKAYQTEIDALSKRSKLSESAFSELLNALRGLPEAAAVKKHLRAQLSEQSAAKGSAQLEEQLRQREAQVTRLSSEVHDLEEELQGVKNQAVTVRRLQQQVKDMDFAADEKVQAAREEKDAEWSKRMEELRQELNVQREQQLEAMAQLSEQRELREDELERLRQQRLEELRLAEQAVLARSVEVDALSSDLERVQAELERERLLRNEAGSAAGSEGVGSMKVLQSLLDGVQQRAAGLEREAADLRRELADAESRAKAAEVRHASELAKAIAGTEEKEQEVRDLEEQLGLRPSFDEVAALRRQLAAIEAVEIADADAGATDIERRSLQRQRELQEQLDEAHSKAELLQKEADSLKSRLQAAEDECGDLRRLVQRLETDLAAEAVAKAPATNREPLAALMAASDAPEGADGGSDEAALASAGGAAAMPSMLDIVTGQRERLRERVGDLEQERDRWRNACEQERKRAEALHADNVKLVERTRYLQSYQPKQGAGGRRPPRGKLEPDLEGRYGGQDESLGPSPFEQFQKDERTRKIASMNVGERLLVTLSAILMASKPARVVTLVYTSALHLLVFTVLWRLALMHAPHG